MKKSAYIIVAIWLIIICGFVFKHEYTIQTGQEVYLKTIPVDPRDILRGDYVVLNYEIAQIPDKNFAYNSTVYALLDLNKDKIAKIKTISYEKPSNSLFLKGKVAYCGSNSLLFRGGKCINFGIESYFVKEGEGSELEENLRKGAYVRTLVDKNGNARVKGFGVLNAAK